MREFSSVDYIDNIERAYVTAPTWAIQRGTLWYGHEGSRVRLAARRANMPAATAIAITATGSINTGWHRNITWALATIATGVIGGHLPETVRRAASLLRARPSRFADALALAAPTMTANGKVSAARKLRNFTCNLYTGGQACKHGSACVTIDRWAMRVAHGLTSGGYVPKGAEYDVIADAYRTVAARYNLPVAILQAITWSAVAEKEGAR